MSTSVTNMLKIALSKSSSKDQLLQQQQQSQAFKLPDDSSRLEKQLRTFISKLQAGATFMPGVYRVADDNAAAEASSKSTEIEKKPMASIRNSTDRRRDSDDDGVGRKKWDKMSSLVETGEQQAFSSSQETKANTRTQNEYDFERDEESGEKMTTTTARKRPEVKPRGAVGISGGSIGGGGGVGGDGPTFEELMQSDEFKAKDKLNFESDED